MYINFLTYKKGDLVSYKGEIWTIVYRASFCPDIYMIRNSITQKEDAEHACNFIPYIKNNKEGKHTLEKFDK